MITALALIPALALSAPPPTARRMGPLLIPMDQGAEAQALKLEGFMNEALEEYPQIVLKKSDDLFGIPPDEEADAAFKRAEQGYRESRIAFDSHQTEDAERKLKATIREYYKAASAMRECGNFCDALAMFGATLLEAGDSEEARLAVLDLISLQPLYELGAKRFSRDFIALRTQVATGKNASLRGNANVVSKPAGARVYLDGNFMGFTPAALQTLPCGKHLLRVERPGFAMHGEFIDVTPEDLDVKFELSPNSAYRSYDALMDKVAAEVSRDKGGQGLEALGKTLGLDRAIIGTLKEISDNGALELTAGFYDLRTGQKLSGKRIVFQGDEYGQLKSEVTRVVHSLINEVDSSEKIAKSHDPLDTQSGMEEWNREGKGEQKDPSATKKKLHSDPLDNVNGTEDW